MSRRRLPLWFRLLMAATAPLVLIGAVWALSRPSRREVIETLARPVSVVGWDGDTLDLSDGRSVPLPELQGLAAVPGPYFRTATARGVEVTADGRVIGLLPVHHWCGNDPVRRHLAKVDLARLLLYVRECPPLHPFSETAGAWAPPPDSPGTWGMRAGDYYQFRRWMEGLDRGEFPLFDPAACD